MFSPERWETIIKSIHTYNILLARWLTWFWTSDKIRIVLVCALIFHHEGIKNLQELWHQASLIHLFQWFLVSMSETISQMYDFLNHLSWNFHIHKELELQQQDHVYAQRHFCFLSLGYKCCCQPKSNLYLKNTRG